MSSVVSSEPTVRIAELSSSSSLAATAETASEVFNERIIESYETLASLGVRQAREQLGRALVESALLDLLSVRHSGIRHDGRRLVRRIDGRPSTSSRRASSVSAPR